MGLPGDTCGFETLARYAQGLVRPKDRYHDKEVNKMRVTKNWRHMLYAGATLATFLLAAGAHFKNS